MSERRTMASLEHMASLIAKELSKECVFYGGSVAYGYSSVLRDKETGRNIVQCYGTMRERYEHMRGFYNGLIHLSYWNRF